MTALHHACIGGDVDSIIDLIRTYPSTISSVDEVSLLIIPHIVTDLRIDITSSTISKGCASPVKMSYLHHTQVILLSCLSHHQVMLLSCLSHTQVILMLY